MAGSPQIFDLIIFVTHVEAEDVYLRIWGQVEKTYITRIERTIRPLSERFARGQGCPGPLSRGLAVDTLCCARFQDDGYYRASIRNIHPDGSIVVQFIDYGNVEVLSRHDVHLLDNIPGTETLKTIPPAASRFTLSNVLPINGVWDPKTVESIKQMLRYGEWKVRVIWTPDGHRFIKLLYDNEDFSELLIKRHMAMPATSDVFGPRSNHAQACRQNGTKALPKNIGTPTTPSVQGVHSSRSVSHETWQNSTPPCRTEPKQPERPVPEALVFKSRVLDVGSTHNVYVSFIEDGPSKFSVQIESTSHILAKLMREINEHPTEPLTEPPLPGSVCLGRYTREDVLCRTVVMSVMQNKCKLYYVDFGHTEVLPYADIFQLPPQYIKPEVLSVRFTLSGVKDLNVTDEMKEYFKSIVTNKLLVLHVRPPEGPPLIQYGDLYDNGKNVKDMLKQAFPAPNDLPAKMSIVVYQNPYQPKKGAKEFVHVSFVESCSKFFVQLEKSVSSLESIMTCLAEYAKTAPTLDIARITVGLSCAALYEQQWYRAKIMDIVDEKIKVLYVDYGNQEVVPISSLRTIHDDLVTKLQAQAIQCSLHGHETLPASEDLSNKFESLTLERRLYMEIVEVHMDRSIVELYNPEKTEDIKSQLRALFPTERNTVVSTDTRNENSPRDMNKRNKIDNWQPPQSDVLRDRGKSKVWKDEFNEDTRHNQVRQDKVNSHYSGSHHDRFSRDAPILGRNENYTERDQNETSPFARGGRTPNSTGKRRGGGYDNRPNRSFDGKQNRSGSSSFEKSWSDKDSDVSSRSSGDKRGRNGPRGGRSPRGGSTGLSERLQNSRWNDRNGEKSNRPERPANKSFEDSRSFKFKDRKDRNNSIVYKKVTEDWDDDRKDRNANVDSVVVESKKQRELPRINISIGDVKQCELVFMNSPYDFFLQLKPECEELNGIMERIGSIYEEGGELLENSKISADVYCVARYVEDLKWYRAIIKSVENKNATVQFIDYGNVESVTFDNIKVIREEFLNLPAQAVRCKLVGVTNCESEAFSAKVDGKFLEAEFVCEQQAQKHDSIYEILLREVIDGVPNSKYINEELSKDFDLVKTRESASKRTATVENERTPPQRVYDYVSLDARWSNESYELGSKRNSIVTWFVNPSNFFCQTCDRETEFRAMMNDIQRIYLGRECARHVLRPGMPIIAVFADDGALYRAEIVDPKPSLHGYMVQYIDFGNCAVVEESKLYSVEKKLMKLPKLAFNCSLKDIKSLDESGWSGVNTKAIDECFSHDSYECTILDRSGDDKYIVSLNFNGQDVGDLLLNRGLAIRAQIDSCDETKAQGETETQAEIKMQVETETRADTEMRADTETQAEPETQIETETPVAPFQPEELETIDITLLSNQTLRAKVSCVESILKFYVQLPSASKTQDAINAYMANKNTEAVALPSELSVVQNQAIECCLRYNDEPTPELNGEFKRLVQEKEVLIYVEEVDNNRLIVKLYDLTGKKINIIKDNTTNEENEENICPICPMPILSSRHNVTVSYANHSGSIWLQRYSDQEVDQKLHEELEKYYSNSGKIISDPVANSLCAARSLEGHWLRGRILDYASNIARVLFIDFGYVEEALPDSLKELDPRFYLPHRLAVNVSLTVTLDASEAEQMGILHTHLSNKEFTAIFYKKVDETWMIELLDDEEKVSEKFRSLNQLEMSRANNSRPHSDCFEVYATHIVSPSEFWLQRADEQDELENLQAEIQKETDEYATISGVPEEGTLCVAVYTVNELWYRAEVIDADEEISTVRFIDYGNMDVIYNESGKIRLLPDSRKSNGDVAKRYAMKCRLDVIPIDSEDWSEQTCERFHSILDSAERLDARITSSDTNTKRVELFANGENVGEILVTEKHAVKIRIEEEPIDEIIDLELDPRAAFVSHVNSPNEFWVQEEKSVADLETMTDRFIVADMFEKLDKIQEGILCVAKFPDDDMWYRARVISHDAERGTQVLFIDYGNSSFSREIRAIPADLAEIPPLSRKCRLRLPEGVTEWSKEACEKFIELSADGATIFLLDVLEEKEDERHDASFLVRLSLEGKSVTDILAEYCQEEERLPPLGEENAPNVVVSHVETPDEFWVQAESSIPELEAISDRLRDAGSFLPLSEYEKGTICAAKYPEDNQWYRARILSTPQHDSTDDAVEVFYVDYGNSAKTSELRVLPVDIVDIPVLSRRCSLRLPDGVSTWSKEASEAFRKLVADGATMFRYESLDDEDPAHVRLNHNGRDVLDILSAFLTKSADKQQEITEMNVEKIEEHDNVENAIVNKGASVETNKKMEAKVDMNIEPISVDEKLLAEENAGQSVINSDTNIEKEEEGSAEANLENLGEACSDICSVDIETELVTNVERLSITKENANGDHYELTVDEIIQNMEKTTTCDTENREEYIEDDTAKLNEKIDKKISLHSESCDTTNIPKDDKQNEEISIKNKTDTNNVGDSTASESNKNNEIVSKESVTTTIDISKTDEKNDTVPKELVTTIDVSKSNEKDETVSKDSITTIDDSKSNEKSETMSKESVITEIDVSKNNEKDETVPKESVATTIHVSKSNEKDETVSKESVTTTIDVSKSTEKNETVSKESVITTIDISQNEEKDESVTKESSATKSDGDVVDTSEEN